MQKGFLNTSAVSTASSAAYAVQQRPGAVLAQRGASGSGPPHQLIIYTQRNDQQPYNSQGQPPNTYTIIQTQPPGSSEQSRAVYPSRPMVNANRQEIQRQYVQTAPNGPATSTSGAGGPQQPGGQPVVHIQLLPHSGAIGGSQQQLVEKRINHIANHPGAHPHSGGHPQILSGHLQHGGPADQVVVTERRPGPSAVHPPAPRQRKRAHQAAPPPPPPVKQEEQFDEAAMHPNHVAVPDAFSHVLDQLHAGGETPKEFYRKLKKQFKYLVYENECYQEELRNSQRHLLKLSRDKNFLLDRLSSYEPVEEPSEDDDSDAASDATIEEKPKAKKKKVQQPRKRTNTSTSAKKAAAAKAEVIKLDEENSQASTEAPTPNPPSEKSAEASTSAPVSEPPTTSSPAVVEAELKADLKAVKIEMDS